MNQRQRKCKPSRNNTNKNKNQNRTKKKLKKPRNNSWKNKRNNTRSCFNSANKITPNFKNYYFKLNKKTNRFIASTPTRSPICNKPTRLLRIPRISKRWQIIYWKLLCRMRTKRCSRMSLADWLIPSRWVRCSMNWESIIAIWANCMISLTKIYFRTCNLWSKKPFSSVVSSTFWENKCKKLNEPFCLCVSVMSWTAFWLQKNNRLSWTVKRLFWTLRLLKTTGKRKTKSKNKSKRSSTFFSKTRLKAFLNVFKPLPRNVMDTH